MEHDNLAMTIGATKNGVGAGRRVVVISGYYSPVHRGHVEYARMAREYAGPEGLVYCIVNNDQQAVLKKGYSFVPQEDRMAIMGALRYVDRAVLSIDTDRTVCRTLQMLCETCRPGERPTHFANGGDQVASAPCPEEPVCRAHGVDLVYGLGDKVQSSSWIIEGSVRAAYDAMCRNKNENPISPDM